MLTSAIDDVQAAAERPAKKQKQSSIASFFSKKPVGHVLNASDHSAPKDETTDDQTSVIVPSWAAEEFEWMEETWLHHLKSEFDKQYFKDLKAFLKQESCKHTVFPPTSMIYAWSRSCPFGSVRVVILGQDPYHNDGQAMGLSFSVPRGVPLPPSLRNIYKEAGVKSAVHGDLTGWAHQGVLLLNTTLTVRAHQPLSHAAAGWDRFTECAIASLNRHRDNLVFMLWGRHAQEKGRAIDGKQHLVLHAAHPSPLSASRGFLGCDHFGKCNAYFQEHGLDTIDWNKL